MTRSNNPSQTVSVWRVEKSKSPTDFKLTREIVAMSIKSAGLLEKWKAALLKSDTLVVIETLRNRWSGTSDIKYIKRRAHRLISWALLSPENTIRLMYHKNENVLQLDSGDARKMILSGNSSSSSSPVRKSKRQVTHPKPSETRVAAARPKATETRVRQPKPKPKPKPVVPKRRVSERKISSEPLEKVPKRVVKRKVLPTTSGRIVTRSKASISENTPLVIETFQKPKKKMLKDSDWQKSVVPRLRKHFQSDGFCRDSIAHKYATKVLNNFATHAMIVADPNDPTEVFGFTLLDYQANKQTLVLMLVCTNYGAKPGLGKALVQKTEALARKLDCRRVLLYAKPEVMRFYRKLGYKNSATCTELKSVTAVFNDNNNTHKKSQKLILNTLEKHPSLVHIFCDHIGRPSTCRIDSYTMSKCIY